VEVVEGLDLSGMTEADSGRGRKPYHPALLLALLIDAYATGCFSSRKIERGTDDSVAVRFIACHSHPDHDTLATFRRRFKAGWLNIDSGLSTLCYETSHPNSGVSSPFPRIRAL
jgi:transposase